MRYVITVMLPTLDSKPKGQAVVETRQDAEDVISGAIFEGLTLIDEMAGRIEYAPTETVQISVSETDCPCALTKDFHSC